MTFISFEEVLTNKDLIYSYLKNFFKIKNFSLYISNNSHEKPAYPYVKYLPHQNQILIYLTPTGKREHIVFSLEIEDSNKMEQLSEHLENIFKIILENIHLKNLQNKDTLFSCLNFKAFIEKISTNIEDISNHLTINNKNLLVSDVEFPSGRFCIIGIRLLNGNTLLEKVGFKKFVATIKKIAHALDEFNFNNVFFDFNKYTFFILTLDIKINILLKKIQEIVTSKHNIDPLILYLTYPDDIPGCLLKKNTIDLSYEILKLLNNGLDVLTNSQNLQKLLSIKDVIEHHGIIEKIISSDIVSINIGEDFGIRYGQYFYIIDKELKETKADLIITNTSRYNSTGKIIFRYNPFNPTKVGDIIKPIKESPKESKRQNVFFILYQKVKSCKKFCLIFINSPEDILNEIFKTLEKFNPYTHNISTNRYIFYIENISIDEEHIIYKKLKNIAKKDKNIYIGIINYPTLNLNIAETINIAIDTLEHAYLLNPPKIAILNSITFNLRGDKSFIKGDIYSAIEEYKISLLLDNKNHIALNSLGVCYAKIGDFTKALNMFHKAIDIYYSTIYLYNLGSIYMKLKDLTRAEEYFLKCINLDPDHIFATIRLSQIKEKKNQLEEAEKLLKTIDPKVYPSVYTLLANIYIKKGLYTKAKEHLETAIRSNPSDAGAIFLLGKIYVEKLKDKKTGIFLIKKSISLRPEKMAYRTYLENL